MQVEPITGRTVLAAAPAAALRGNPAAPSADSETSATLTLPGAKSGNTAGTPSSDQEPDVEQAVKSLEEAVRGLDIALNFSRDDKTGAIVIKLIDQQSGETVQQIPTEATLRLSAALGKLQGQLFSRKA